LNFVKAICDPGFAAVRKHLLYRIALGGPCCNTGRRLAMPHFFHQHVAKSSHHLNIGSHNHFAPVCRWFTRSDLIQWYFVVAGRRIADVQQPENASYEDRN